MSFVMSVKRRVRASIPPIIFLALAAYFAWNATRGDRGLVAQQQDRLDLQAAQVQLAHANEEAQQWQNRVLGIGGKVLDLDALDAQARSMLNLVNPDDRVVMMGNGTPASGLPAPDPGSVIEPAPLPATNAGQ